MNWFILGTLECFSLSVRSLLFTFWFSKVMFLVCEVCIVYVYVYIPMYIYVHTSACAYVCTCVLGSNMAYGHFINNEM